MGKPAPLIVINQTGNLFEASAPGYWDATTTGGIARGIVSADGATVHGTGGWTHDLTTPWTLQVSALQSGAPACSKIATIVNGTVTAAWSGFEPSKIKTPAWRHHRHPGGQ